MLVSLNLHRYPRVRLPTRALGNVIKLRFLLAEPVLSKKLSTQFKYLDVWKQKTWAMLTFTRDMKAWEYSHCSGIVTNTLDQIHIGFSFVDVLWSEESSVNNSLVIVTKYNWRSYLPKQVVGDEESIDSLGLVSFHDMFETVKSTVGFCL